MLTGRPRYHALGHKPAFLERVTHMRFFSNSPRAEKDEEDDLEQIIPETEVKKEKKEHKSPRKLLSPRKEKPLDLNGFAPQQPQPHGEDLLCFDSLSVSPSPHPPSGRAPAAAPPIPQRPAANTAPLVPSPPPVPRRPAARHSVSSPSPSSPSSASSTTSNHSIDPFDQFLATHPETVTHATQSTGPNYFCRLDELREKEKPTQPTASPSSAFDDLLSSSSSFLPSFPHGQRSSFDKKEKKTIADMRADRDREDMTPEEIRIRDWTRGKERNIRALLGSMNDVLWEGADKWTQPTMADLLTAAQVKKSYRRACLVVHPDKQTGQLHESLARAVFLELNDAWNTFESAGQPSL